MTFNEHLPVHVQAGEDTHDTDMPQGYGNWAFRLMSALEVSVLLECFNTPSPFPRLLLCQGRSWAPPRGWADSPPRHRVEVEPPVRPPVARGQEPLQREVTTCAVITWTLVASHPETQCLSQEFCIFYATKYTDGKTL